MKIRFGYRLRYRVAGPTPMVFLLQSQPRPDQRPLRPDTLTITPPTTRSIYRDMFGNLCARLIAPSGTSDLSADGVVEDPGLPEPANPSAGEIAVDALPTDTLQFLLPSRYCESDALLAKARDNFGNLSPGWGRVQAICDFVNERTKFGYEYARSTKTALDTFNERCGVCRDMAHLAIAFCRALNIPARYCTSYLGDIGMPAVEAPVDFAASMEVYLDGGWHVFDPRNNARRIGRLPIARGRDAADVAISTSFGATALEYFQVHTDELPGGDALEHAA